MVEHESHTISAAINPGHTGSEGSDQFFQTCEQDVGENGPFQMSPQAFDQIQDELRTQYLASYTPKNTEADGKFRKLDYDCGKGRKIEARKGYYAIAGDGDSQ